MIDFEAEKDALRQRQRQHLAEQRANDDADHDRTVRAYWDERASVDPDDPDVLRARAAIIDRERGVPNRDGVTVTATPAITTAVGVGA